MFRHKRIERSIVRVPAQLFLRKDDEIEVQDEFRKRLKGQLRRMQLRKIEMI